MPTEFIHRPIGYLTSDFSEKFGVPRQSMMVPEARAILKLNPDSRNRLALTQLESFSHIWLVFVFHKSASRDWRPLIEPPKEDLKEKVGVFASRSPDRPNPIGISAVRLEKINFEAKEGIEIHLSGVDLLDGTPVLDIKPYLPYADSIPEANSGWAEGEIKKYPVTFSDSSLEAIKNSSHPRLHELLLQMLEWDPRPTSQRKANPIQSQESQGLRFAFRIFEFDVHWRISNYAIDVFEIKKA